MIYKDTKLRSKSPFYKAIDNQSIWAVELFCDHGADLESINCESTKSPLIYAAENNLDEMCMYLSLRTKNVDLEDNDGNNIFNMYLIKEDKQRCMQLLMRNANINYVNKLGKTPLHIAIEHQLNKGIIKFLLQAGASPYIKDNEGKDSCDKVRELKDKYTTKDSPIFRVFWEKEIRIISPKVMPEK
mgnify:CR=1 FL=1